LKHSFVEIKHLLKSILTNSCSASW